MGVRREKAGACMKSNRSEQRGARRAAWLCATALTGALVLAALAPQAAWADGGAGGADGSPGAAGGTGFTGNTGGSLISGPSGGGLGWA